MLGLERSEGLWLCCYLPISWLTQFGHGMVTTVVGPTQPYLARNTGVAIDTVNFVWTFGFLGYLVGSLLTGFIFRQYVRTAARKLFFMFFTICITGAFMIVLPFTSSFGVLVAGRLVQLLSLGAFVTADASLMVYLLGPDKSRPFTMALHALIGAGFLAATFLVRPFLPSEAELDKDILCSRDRNQAKDAANSSAVDGVIFQPIEDDELAIPTIAWPFIISGVWCVVFSLGFLVLACLPLSMPCYYHHNEEENESADGTSSKGPSISCAPLFFALVFAYYFVSCGIERIYQPMASTFGLCGPLDLSPAAAATTDSFYNGGFMCGRIVSAFVAGLISPRNMILISLSSCVVAASVLSAIAGFSVNGLYAGTAVLGFFISWQFGSCFSWVAKKMNVTGRLSSLFFIGCGAGSLATPPLSGFIFTSSWGPMSIIYLTLVLCVLQCLIYLAMWLLARHQPPTLHSLT